MKAARLIVVLFLAAGLAACDRKSSNSSSASGGSANAQDSHPTNRDETKLTTPDGRTITKGKEAKPPDLLAASKTPPFQAAVKRVAELTGRQSQPFVPAESDSNAPTGSVLFKVPHNTVEASLDKWRKELLAKGAYLVRHENSFGIGGANADDELVLVPTTDKYVVLAAVQTDGVNFGIMTGDIIDWLKGMEKSQPFELTEAGMDYCAGRFTTPLKDAKTLSKQMYDFCPDIVDQGTGDVDKLEAELGKGTFFFWWD